eukprot:scaffold51459_cov62-Phaeocystis_antarctica.AAC.1
MATLRLGRAATAPRRLGQARAARALPAVGSGSLVALPSARVVMTALVAAVAVAGCTMVPLLAARMR